MTFESDKWWTFRITRILVWVSMFWGIMALARFVLFGA